MTKRKKLSKQGAPPPNKAYIPQIWGNKVESPLGERVDANLGRDSPLTWIPNYKSESVNVSEPNSSRRLSYHDTESFCLNTSSYAEKQTTPHLLPPSRENLIRRSFLDRFAWKRMKITSTPGLFSLTYQPPEFLTHNYVFKRILYFKAQHFSDKKKDEILSGEIREEKALKPLPPSLSPIATPRSEPLVLEALASPAIPLSTGDTGLSKEQQCSEMSVFETELQPSPFSKIPIGDTSLSTIPHQHVLRLNRDNLSFEMSGPRHNDKASPVNSQSRSSESSARYLNPSYHKNKDVFLLSISPDVGESHEAVALTRSLNLPSIPGAFIPRKNSDKMPSISAFPSPPTGYRTFQDRVKNASSMKSIKKTSKPQRLPLGGTYPRSKKAAESGHSHHMSISYSECLAFRTCTKKTYATMPELEDSFRMSEIFPLSSRTTQEGSSKPTSNKAKIKRKNKRSSARPALTSKVDQLESNSEGPLSQHMAFQNLDCANPPTMQPSVDSFSQTWEKWNTSFNESNLQNTQSSEVTDNEAHSGREKVMFGIKYAEPKGRSATLSPPNALSLADENRKNDMSASDLEQKKIVSGTFQTQELHPLSDETQYWTKLINRLSVYSRSLIPPVYVNNEELNHSYLSSVFEKKRIPNRFVGGVAWNFSVLDYMFTVEILRGWMSNPKVF